MSETITISLNELRPGIVLPSAIFDGKNPDLLLLGQGVRVTKQNVDRLFARGVTSIAIAKDFADQISGKGGSSNRSRTDSSSQLQEEKEHKQQMADEISKAPLIQQMNKKSDLEYNNKTLDSFKERQKQKGATLKQFMSNASLPGFREGKQIHSIAVQAIEDLVQDIDVFVKLAISPDGDNDDQSHCVRVSELAMAVAAVMEYPRKKIEELGVGCLIYRSVMSKKTVSLRDEKRELTAIERLEFTKNPKLMFEVLKDVAGLSVGARQVAYQVCERWDGSGYPRHRIGNQIHPLARIATVADVYIALTSPRPHRPAFEAYRAVEIILNETRDRKFDPKVVKAFLQTVCLYPIGSYVELSDGSTAVVIRTNVEFFDNPVVQIIFNKKGHRIVPRMIDLSKLPELKVVSAIECDIIEAMVVATEKSFTIQKTFAFANDY